MLAGDDTLTIAGTGAGKILPFVMPVFVLDKVIIWTLAPLNYIQEQQVNDFTEMGLSAVYVNQNTNWKKVKREILRGQYQVVISSPEAFLDVDKLRGVVLAEELADYRYFVIVDEAHVIHKWGGEFPATATATKEIKETIKKSLHLGTSRPLRVTNLGNFRLNLVYSVYRMTGGAESYHEITHLFPDRTRIPKFIVFVDTVDQAKYIVEELRKHFNLADDERYRIRAYFSNRAESGEEDAAVAFKNGQCDGLASTEALTMGCDFSDVELVIQWTAPDLACTHLQRMGRGGRTPEIRSRAIMTVTSDNYKRALKLVGGGRIREQRPDDFLDPKREEDDLLGDIEAQEDDGDAEGDAETRTYKPNPNSRVFDLDIARFITAENCYIKILDEIFDNPEHIPCYEAGTCSLCADRRARHEAIHHVDVQALDRAIKREQVDNALALDEGEDSEDAELHTRVKRKTPATTFTGKEFQRRRECLRAWRISKFETESLTCYVSLEDIATEQALDAIARSRQALDLASLDTLKPQWPLRDRWGEEVLAELGNLHKRMESEKVEKEAKRIEDRARAKAAKQEATRQEEVENLRRREAELVARRQQQETATGAHQIAPRVAQPAPFARQTHPRLRNNPPLVQATPTQVLPPPPTLHRHVSQQFPPPTPPNFPPNVVGSAVGRVSCGSQRSAPTYFCWSSWANNTAFSTQITSTCVSSSAPYTSIAYTIAYTKNPS